MKLALLAKAIGHPARVAIIDYLLKVNSCICGDIVDKLPLAQATVSQHLKELKTAGIIRGTIEGNSICYCLNEKAIGRLRDFFAIYSAKMEESKNACC